MKGCKGHIHLLPWTITPDSSKTDTAAPGFILHSARHLPGTPGNLGCYHMLGWCCFPAIVDQASQDTLWSYMSMALCVQTLPSRVPKGKSKAMSDIWSAKPVHIFVQSWRFSLALHILLTSCLANVMCVSSSLLSASLTQNYFPLKKGKASKGVR